MQTDYNLYMEPGFNGMKADSGYDDVKSMVAYEDIPFGRSVVKCYGKNNLSRLPILNTLVITDSGGTFTAGDIVATILENVVTRAFGTDKDTSVTALAAQIAALDGIISCAYNSGAHTITIVSENDTLEGSSVDVSDITGNMTISSYVYTSTDVLLGISVATHKETEHDCETVQYNEDEAVNVMTKGRIYSYCEEAIGSDDSTLYTRCHNSGATKQRGQLLKTSTAETSGTNSWAKRAVASGVKIIKTITGAGLTIAEVHFP